MLTLSLTNACLTELPDITAIPFQSLNLKGNRFQSLENLPITLKDLDISCNSLHSEGLHQPLIHLERLQASHNYFCFITTDEFVLLFPSLKTLDMSFNHLQTVGFLRDSSVEELNITHNRLHLLSALPLTLKRLIADTNKINMIQSKLPPTLELLDVAYNSLRFAGLPLSWPMTLKELHLDRNRIEKFPRKLPDSLEVLTLSENNLTELPRTLPQNLHTLIASSNKIRFLPTYKSHKKFQIFILNNNCLTDVPREFNATVFTAHENWNQSDHTIAQTIIKRCWKRYVITLRLRHLYRTQKYKEELFMVSMMPERWEQVDVLDPVWFRKPPSHSRTDRHSD